MNQPFVEEAEVDEPTKPVLPTHMKTLSILSLIVLASAVASPGEESSISGTKAEVGRSNSDVAPSEKELRRTLNSPLFAEEGRAESFLEAAGLAYSEGAVERAALLLYLGQVRAAIDLKAYEPTEIGGNSPIVALDAMQQMAGSYINPAAVRDREMFARVIARVSFWNPTYSPKYSPGWDFKSEVTKASFEQIVQDAKKRWLESMSNMAKLLRDDEYYKLILLAQDFNFRHEKRKPWDPQGKDIKTQVTVTEEEYNDAVSKMKSIEKRLGVASLLSDSDVRQVSEQ
jgi:hypothetical protein